MAVAIGLAVSTFAAAGLAIFVFCYRGTRAKAVGLSAFALGLAVTVVFTAIHASAAKRSEVSPQAVRNLRWRS
jgi:hypothetical protein